MTEQGLISALVTVRNGEAFIRESLDSLLAQRDDRFEIIVVDDGSTDSTLEILQSYGDERVSLHAREAAGRVDALMYAASVARGELLAVLDADDVALPNRFAVQRAYLNRHPDVALVGSAATEFGACPEHTDPVPTGPQAVRRALGMYNPFYHSSVMFRRAAYEAVGGYLPDGGWGHDFALLLRIAVRYPIDILSEPLIRYRRHARQITTSPDGEAFRRRRSACLQLQAARELRLPAHLWLFPLLGWMYAQVPARLRPRQWKDPVKHLLLRFIGIREDGSPGISPSDVPLLHNDQTG